MTVQEIVAQLDSEISRLRQARALLAPLTEESPRDPGRPKETTKLPPAAKQQEAPKRQLTAEGKRRIAAAPKARWAARKSEAERTPRMEEVTTTEPSTEVPIAV